MIYQVISQSKIVWTMYFVDIVVSYGFFCAAVQRINFFFSLSTTDVGE